MDSSFVRFAGAYFVAQPVLGRPAWSPLCQEAGGNEGPYDVDV
jgi:hypothetical protein